MSVEASLPRRIRGAFPRESASDRSQGARGAPSPAVTSSLERSVESALRLAWRIGSLRRLRVTRVPAKPRQHKPAKLCRLCGRHRRLDDILQSNLAVLCTKLLWKGSLTPITARAP